MGAFILAGLVAVVTIVVWLIAMFAAGMSASPSASSDVASTANVILISGLVAAGLVACSHWMPHIGW